MPVHVYNLCIRITRAMVPSILFVQHTACLPACAGCTHARTHLHASPYLSCMSDRNPLHSHPSSLPQRVR